MLMLSKRSTARPTTNDHKTVSNHIPHSHRHLQSHNRETDKRSSNSPEGLRAFAHLVCCAAYVVPRPPLPPVVRGGSLRPVVDFKLPRGDEGRWRRGGVGRESARLSSGGLVTRKPKPPTNQTNHQPTAPPKKTTNQPTNPTNQPTNQPGR